MPSSTCWMASQEPVADWGFSVGSKILWTQNSYDRPTGKVDSKGMEITVDIMNCALGVIANVIDKDAMARFDDGTETMLSRNDLARILRSWPITVHKAQGSAFKTVLIPVVRSRLLDRAMLYTAVTRARLAAVLIGEEALMRRVVGAPPRAWQRLQAQDIDRAARRAGSAVKPLSRATRTRNSATLTIEVLCSEALVQELDAVHLGLCAASAVIPTPSLPDGPSEAP